MRSGTRRLISTGLREAKESEESRKLKVESRKLSCLLPLTFDFVSDSSPGRIVMSNRASRRDFLKTSVAASCGAALGGAAAGPAGAASASAVAPSPLPIKKGVLLGMLPKQLSYADRFKMARDVGFEVVKDYTTSAQHETEERKKAADDAK